MGIADDIRPKKFRRVSSREEKNIATKTSVKKEIDHKLFSEKNNDDFFADTPIANKTASKVKVEPKAEKKKKTLGWFYWLLFFIIIVLVGFVLVWQNFDIVKSYFDGSYKKENDKNLNDILESSSNSNENYSGEATTTTPAPAVTTAPAIDKTQIMVSVLNGSGVKNSAATATALLTAAGFNATNSGNAKSFNYASTIVCFKTGKSAEAELVKAALTGYSATTSENNSVVGANFDIVVIVGKK